MGKFFRFAKSLRDKISWTWEYGVNQMDSSQYRLEYTSSAIKDSVFETVAGKYVDLSDKKLADIKVGEKFELTPETIKHNHVALLLGLPKAKPTSIKFLTRNVVEVHYEKTSEGWIVFIGVEGIRRVF